MQLSEQQMYNEALIQLVVLLYQIDGRVSLSEQDYLDALMEGMSWESPISRQARLNAIISETRQCVEQQQHVELLQTLKPILNMDADKTLEVAMAITAVDGERSEPETELLALLTHKILSKALLKSFTPPLSTVPLTAG
jgi:tellurite resistance protein